MTVLFLFTLLSSCSMMTYTNQGKLSNTSQTYIINCAFWDACYAKAYVVATQSALLPRTLHQHS